MLNLFISFLYLLISFSITIICYKKYGKYGLYIWMCILVIICNIQTVKMSEIFGFTITLGNISYGAIFLTTDILSEKYGKEATDTATKLSFIFMIIFTLFMSLFLKYEPSSSDFSQEALTTIFNYMPRITIAGLSAYYISQRCDAKFYQLLKSKYNKVWISNNVSTIISQTIDTIIFTIISFLGILSFHDIISLMFTMLIFKYLIALLDTPFMILITKIKTNREL